MERNAQPRLQCPWRGPRDGNDEIIVRPVEGPALAVLPSVIYLFPGESSPLTASSESEPPAARAITENRPTAV